MLHEVIDRVTQLARQHKANPWFMFLDCKKHPQHEGVESNDDDDDFENDEVSDDESVDEDMQVETVGEDDRTEGDESVIEYVLVKTADKEAEEIAGVHIAEENAGVPLANVKVEEIAGVPLAEENAGEPLAGLAGVLHADEIIRKTTGVVVRGESV